MTTSSLMLLLKNTNVTHCKKKKIKKKIRQYLLLTWAPPSGLRHFRLFIIYCTVTVKVRLLLWLWPSSDAVTLLTCRVRHESGGQMSDGSKRDTLFMFWLLAWVQWSSTDGLEPGPSEADRLVLTLTAGWGNRNVFVGRMGIIRKCQRKSVADGWDWQETGPPTTSLAR